MTLRRILFWLHLSAGSIAGIFILIMCVTGVCLAFERQINAFADSWGRPPVQMGTARLAVDDLMQDGARDTAGLTAVTVSSQRREPVALTYGRQKIVFVDPYTGKALGESSKTSRAFFAGLERWHRALGAELHSHGPGRRERFVSGAAAFRRGAVVAQEMEAFEFSFRRGVAARSDRQGRALEPSSRDCYVLRVALAGDCDERRDYVVHMGQQFALHVDGQHAACTADSAAGERCA
jgi:hypothetical protein